MALESHYVDQLTLSLFDKEAVYDAGPAAWDGTAACSMMDFDDASAHEQWDDTVVTNNDLITGKELITRQQLVRYSVRLGYTEPRSKPNTMAGLAALALGTVASTRDGVENAWRHRISMASAVALPSIGMMTKRQAGAQYLYKGIKSNDYELSNNGAFWQFRSTLVGSGNRAVNGTGFPASVTEDWVLWGDSKFFLYNTAGSPIGVPTNPTQGAASLTGASAIDISTRVKQLSHSWNNNFPLDDAYRPSTGKLRKEFHGNRRAGTMSIRIETDTVTEAAELGYYLSQTQMALEINCDSGVLIDATGGTFRYGFILVLPRLQFHSRNRDQDEGTEVDVYEANIMDDSTNSPVIWFVYNARSVYLA